ncbi:hypothetical protein DPMN_074477 [Dreissena polymorpha]|uniref:TIR domain-containing protein n=1 Tax=Dreissena polymorpha TaxID=45954 RepID=A0A9D3YJB5_DREPO|nr:hypothetical protein DPMN_074477 [Dreissena polymorpha]
MSRKRFFGYRRLPDYTLIENYRFDAFISYAEDNFRFILDEVIPRLEAENVSLCLHQRDFLPGNAISDNIIHAIQSSRKPSSSCQKRFEGANGAIMNTTWREWIAYTRGKTACV